MKSPLKSIKEWQERRWMTHDMPKWELKRKKGRRSYTIRLGLLVWLSINIAFPILDGKLPFADAISAIPKLPTGDIIKLLSFELALQIMMFGFGCLAGFAGWESTEKKYWKTKAQENE